MPDLTDYSLKEVMEVIEERLPFGRKITTVLLGLLIIWVATAALSYLYHALVAPVVSLVEESRKPNTPVWTMLGPIVGGLCSGLLFFLLANWFSKRVISHVNQIHDWSRKNVEGERQFMEEALRSHADFVKTAERINDRLGATLDKAEIVQQALQAIQQSQENNSTPQESVSEQALRVPSASTKAGE